MKLADDTNNFLDTAALYTNVNPNLAAKTSHSLQSLDIHFDNRGILPKLKRTLPEQLGLDYGAVGGSGCRGECGRIVCGGELRINNEDYSECK